MDILDLAPGVHVLTEGHLRIVKRVVMHPAGPVVLWEPSESSQKTRSSFDYLHHSEATIVPSAFMGTARERMAAIL